MLKTPRPEGEEKGLNTFYEVCYIQLKDLETPFTFKLIYWRIKMLKQFIVIHEGKVIDRSPEILFDVPAFGIGKAARKDVERYEERKEGAYQKILQRLLSEGWEPLAAGEEGRFMSFRRQVGGAKESHASSPAVLLEQLGALRDAGVLTHGEFEEKKKEILSRI